MADRYWVGGTASWDSSAGTKWATTSGGTGGASVPTTADDVFFTNLSTGTVTIAAGNAGAKSINCTGFTGTITGTNGITVAGSITLSSGMTYSNTATVTIQGTGTLTTAGKAFSALTINGVGITVTLGDALNLATRNLIVTSGTFDTANYNVSAGTFTSANSILRTLNLGSSTITLSGSGGFNVATSTNLTFNVGTSQINLTSFAASLFGGGQTFYNVSFTSTGTGTRIIQGENTFNNLTLTTGATGLVQLSINSNQTVNGTFTCAGTSPVARGFVRASTIGTTTTITANVISANDCDFRDITLAGSAAGASPTRAGDCGNNSGINFPAAKTVYFNFASTANWNSTAWATTPSGTPDINNFPLPQDTATFTDSGSASTVATIFGFNIGTLDASGRTSAMTLTLNGSCNFYGNFTLGSGVTVSGTSGQTFSGRGTQTFTSAGKTITPQITVDKPAGAFELGDATSTTNTITHQRGTFDAKNYNLTCTTFSSLFTTVRTITMGSGLWTLSGTGTIWNTGNTTNLTFNKDTANILLSNTTTTGRIFTGGGLSFNKLTIGGTTGTSITTINSTNTFTELASTKTVAHTITFSDVNAGTIGTWSVTGSSGNVVTVNSSAVGTRRTFTLTNVTSGIDYLSVTDIGVTDANKFYVGANSTDGGNNLNVYFTASPGGGISVSILELLTLTDAQSALYAFASQVVESETLTDAQSALYTLVGNIAETETLTDAENAIAIFSNTISESETLTDAQTGGLQFTVTTTETETLTDTQTGGLLLTATTTETETLTDTENAVGIFPRTVTETETLTDAETVTLTLTVSTAESETLTESQSGAYILVGRTTESITLSDIPSSLAVFVGSVAESQTLVDLITGNTVYPNNTDETITLTEVSIGERTLYFTAVETQTLTETQSATYIFVGNTAEVIPLTDAVSSLAIFNNTQIEQFLLFDTPIGRGWTTVNVNQAADWDSVNNNQSPVWGPVNANQAVTWNLVNNNQSPVWGTIDTNQPPNWNVIDDSQQ